MWTVTQSKKTTKALKKVPSRIAKAYGLWVEILESQGPQGLLESRGYNDEALTTPWAGYRSSRLSGQYRVIYKVEGDRLVVLAVAVTAHDYRRR